MYCQLEFTLHIQMRVAIIALAIAMVHTRIQRQVETQRMHEPDCSNGNTSKVLGPTNHYEKWISSEESWRTRKVVDHRHVLQRRKQRIGHQLNRIY